MSPTTRPVGTVRIVVVVDSFHSAQRGGGVPTAVRALMADEHVSGVIVTSTLDTRTGERPVSERGALAATGVSVDDRSVRMPRLWTAIVAHRPEVVVLTSPFSRRTIRVLLGRWMRMVVARGAAGGPPLVIWSHGEMGARALVEKPLRKRAFLVGARLLGMFRAVIWFVSDEHEAPAVRRLTGLDSEYRPIGLSPVDAPLEPTTKRAGQLDLVYVGRIVERKGLHLALDALRLVDGSVRFTIVGPAEDRPYAERCRRLAAQLPPSIEVSFVGGVEADEVPARFAAHDASILATEYESFGYTTYESLCQGCVPVVSRFTPFDFDGTAGGVHVDLTPESVAAELQRLIDETADEFAVRRRAARALAEQMSADDVNVSEFAARLAALVP